MPNRHYRQLARAPLVLVLEPVRALEQVLAQVLAQVLVQVRDVSNILLVPHALADCPRLCP